MDPFTIREFKFPEDYPAAYQLWSDSKPGIQVRRSDDPEEIQKKLKYNPDLFLVAELDGKLVGTVMGGFDGRRGMVYHLAVDAACQKLGIGGKLMEDLEKRLQAKGCRRCYLMVVKGNEEVMEFYTKRGWSRMETVYTFAKDIE